MSLSSEEIWTVCDMRMRGCTWKEVGEAIPNKNIYKKNPDHITNHPKSICF
jgi:hypothetical protein